MSKSSRIIYYPIVVAIVLVVGIYVGIELQLGAVTPYAPAATSSSRINEILGYIEHEYVDSVDREALEEKIIQYALQELDPHSFYISAADFQSMNEPLEGNFEGVGIEFNIQSDTLMVIAAVSGGPSEKVGVMAGDRIVRVDSIDVAGVGLSNKRVIELLRGEKGSEVALKVKRNNKEDLLDFTIVRDKIPIYSVDASYMLEDSIGYVKVARFAKTTAREFKVKTAELLEQGMTKLVLDLRGNGGGYMDAAIKMVDEFLQSDLLIVYTEGKARRRRDYASTLKGNLKDIELCVLINEGSASASEIVSGAIQDNDRGTIVGRRSFGKGLVQEPSDWPDGSSIRLTIARYYTPTGRCIQKPYTKGNKAYNEEYYERAKSGELMNADSVAKVDSLKYTTPGGKVVYGGGGITPDVFVPIDTTGSSYYYSEMMYSGIIRRYAFEYADNHREELSKFSDMYDMVENFTVTNEMFETLIEVAEKKGLKKSKFGKKHSRELILNSMKASICRNMFKNDGYYAVQNKMDAAVQQAKDILK